MFNPVVIRIKYNATREFYLIEEAYFFKGGRKAAFKVYKWYKCLAVFIMELWS